MSSSPTKETPKKRKRSSPFRIKVGCVVALRYKPVTGNHVTMIVPPPRGSPVDSTPTKHALHCLAGTESHVEVWTDPIPGRDEGLALIGRRVRCCFTREVSQDSQESDNNGPSINGAPKPSKKFKNVIIEGEVVSILSHKKINRGEGKIRTKSRADSDCTEVELLIDRDVLGRVAFLERVDEDVNVEEIKKESAKRAYQNEEAIKGRNLAAVKVKLADASGIISLGETGNSGRSDGEIAKWAIRKRIANEPGQLSHPTGGVAVGGRDEFQIVKKGNGKIPENKSRHEQSGQNSSVGDVTMLEAGNEEKSERSNDPNAFSKKSRKVNSGRIATTSPTQFMGNKNDDASQQQRNWRWFSARFYDYFLAERDFSTDPFPTILNRNDIDFLKHYSRLLSCCGGFLGEVLEVVPSSRKGTLAMVTMRRLILPEHTVCGRSTAFGGDFGMFQAFDDYDSTLLGRKQKMDVDEDAEKGAVLRNEDNLASVVFRVPIEELIIVCRQLKRHLSNEAPILDPRAESNVDKELAVEFAYSWSADCFVRLKNMGSKNSEMEKFVPRPLTKKKIRKLSLCHRCRTWCPKKQVSTCENSNCDLQRQFTAGDNYRYGENDKPPSAVVWCNFCLNRVQSMESVLDQDFTTDTRLMTDLPCCTNQCDCRFCHTSVVQRKAQENMRIALKDAQATNLGGAPEGKNEMDTNFDTLPFRGTDAMLKSMKICDFDIPVNLIDLEHLPLLGSKLITTKVKASARKEPRASSTLTKSYAEKRKPDGMQNKKPTKKSKSNGVVSASQTSCDLRAMGGDLEDFSIFKPTCARLLDYADAAKAKAIRKAANEEILRSIMSADGDTPRNLRELMEKKSSQEVGKRSDNDEKTLSSRAARASQRRLVKDVAMLGASSLNLDTLSGRESQMRFDRSGIHGWGVFADVEISAGDMIIE